MQFDASTKDELDAFTQHGKGLQSVSQMSKSSKKVYGNSKSASRKRSELLPIEEGDAGGSESK